jgi:hypothetical protein
MKGHWHQNFLCGSAWERSVPPLVPWLAREDYGRPAWLFEYPSRLIAGIGRAAGVFDQRGLELPASVPSPVTNERPLRQASRADGLHRKQKKPRATRERSEANPGENFETADAGCRLIS